MIRRVGLPPHKGKKYSLRPGVYAILPRAGQILLTHQSRPASELQLPGGGIDPGENPVRALHREVFEETGWRITGALRLGAFRRFAYMPEYDLWAEKLCSVYLARPTRRISAPVEPDHSVVWLQPKHAAVSLANSGDRLFVEQHML